MAELIDTIFWWTGATVCAVGVLAALAAAVMFPLDYCWRRWGDMETLIRVQAEAIRQGRSIFRRTTKGEKNGR